MERYKCRACAFTFSEADRSWDAAIDSGRCPNCSVPLHDFPVPVRGQKVKPAAPLSPISSVSVARFCSSCGAPVTPGSKFCVQCGAALTAATQLETKEASSQTSRGERQGYSVNWYFEVLKKYAVFDGRARRKEYWYFVLFNSLVHIMLVIIDVVMGTFTVKGGLGLLSGIFFFAVLLPSIAVSVRRLHDTNRSGWFLLIGLIPLIGGIVLLLFMAEDGQQGENQYGSNPKADSA